MGYMCIRRSGGVSCEFGGLVVLVVVQISGLGFKHGVSLGFLVWCGVHYLYIT